MKDITIEESIKYVKAILEYPKLYASTENEEDFLRGIDKTEIEEVLNELKKQNRIIDAMADSLAEEGYYADKCQSKIEADECDENCQNCIKQYFERKIENE